jgi:hypothetical protein
MEPQVLVFPHLPDFPAKFGNLRLLKVKLPLECRKKGAAVCRRV